MDESETTRSTPIAIISPILTNDDFNNLLDYEAQMSPFQMKMIVKDIIGGYFTSSKAKLLFNFRKDESACDWLTGTIDKFDAILDNKEDGMSTIVNHATEKNCALNESQVTILLQRTQLLITVYLFIFASHRRTISLILLFVKRSINHSKPNGLEYINNYWSIMRWNDIYS